MPNEDNPGKGIFNQRAAQSIGELVDLAVISLRTWRPGRQMLRLEDHNNYMVWHCALPHKPDNRPWLSWLNYFIISLLLRNRLGKKLKEFDLIHSAGGSYAPVGAALARFAGARHIVQLTGSDIYSEFPRIKSAPHVSRMLKKTDMVTGNSRALVKEYNNLFNTEYEEIAVYRGIDLKLFPSQPFSGTNPVFLFIGGLSQYAHYRHRMNTKGGLTLMEAWKNVENHMAEMNAKLLFGGPDTPNEVLIKWLEELKHPNLVEVIGAVHPDELHEIYARSSVVVLPSMEEGMPNVAVEAMASGRMVIGANVGGVPELIDDRDNGMIFQSGNVDALKTCLIEAARAPEKTLEMGIRSRIIVEQHFNAVSFGPAYYKLYEGICAA